ncbi:hypothetical protein [Streptomyces sp. AM6-12]|uniref:hypothetical protein n=1 Tax=Streptomyces sp. AM6-12 TaxID=3345149 RepID=UPI003798235C
MDAAVAPGGRGPDDVRGEKEGALNGWWVKAYRGTYGKTSERDLPAFTTRWSVGTSSAGGYAFHDCSEPLTVAPRSLVNSDATTWKTVATATKEGSGYDTDTLSTTVRLQRASRIQGTNASPEPVTKGKAITVTATKDGTGCWSYSGNTTRGASNSTGDCVDVR